MFTPSIGRAEDAHYDSKNEQMVIFQKKLKDLGICFNMYMQKVVGKINELQDGTWYWVFIHCIYMICYMLSVQY